MDSNRKKYCRFKKLGIRYVDFKDPDFLMRFVNEQGKMLPRRITGNSLKFQRKCLKQLKELDILFVTLRC
ncbi:MAG: 30S ribosomal protein S18 [Bacteroidetes bacterium]|nr:30S ribosomal protein S18 [Bacteroidota bacterium]